MPITGNKNADGLKPKKLPYDPGSMNAHEIEAVNAILLRTTGCHFSKSAYQYVMTMMQKCVADWEPIPIAVEKVEPADVPENEPQEVLSSSPNYIFHKLPDGSTKVMDVTSGKTHTLPPDAPFYPNSKFKLAEPVPVPHQDCLYSPFNLTFGTF